MYTVPSHISVPKATDRAGVRMGHSDVVEAKRQHLCKAATVMTGTSRPPVIDEAVRTGPDRS